jgi:WD40 repeat protein
MSVRLKLQVVAIVVLAIAPPGTVQASSPAVQATRVIRCANDDQHRPAVVTGVAISADGQLIAAASDDHAVRLWNVETGELRACLNGHRDWVRTVALSADGRTLASGANDHTVVLWNAMSG